MADLFDLADLKSWLKVPQIDTEEFARVLRAVNGWLQDATDLTVWPDPVPDYLWAWAIELAGIAYDNPTANASESTGGVSTTKDRARRAQILEAAQQKYNPAGKPQGSFPQPDWSWNSTTPSTLHD